MSEDSNIVSLVERELYSVVNEALRDKITSNNIFVGELTGCLRQAYFVRKYGKSYNEDMLMGMVIHEIIVDKLASKLGCMSEVEGIIQEDAVTIAGRADILCDDYIVEVKTSKYPVIKDTWVKQCQAYMKMFNKDKCIVAVLERPSLNPMMVSMIKRNESIIDELLRRAKEYYVSLTENVIPQTIDTSLCSVCNFKALCHKIKTLDKYR